MIKKRGSWLPEYWRGRKQSKEHINKRISNSKQTFRDNHPLIKTKCAFCLKILNNPPYKIKRSKRNFCNKKCQGEYMSKHFSEIYGEERNKKLSDSLKGREFTKEHKLNMSKNHADFSGDNHPLRKIGGHSEKTKINLSNIRKEWWTSIRNTPEYDELILKFRNIKRPTGKDSSNWIDGRSYIPYPKEFNSIRKKIREHYNYQCQICGIIKFKRLDVHHIDSNKNNNNFLNLIPLCRDCHSKTKINREFWFNYLNKLKGDENGIGDRQGEVLQQTICVI